MFKLALNFLTLLAAIGCDKPDAPATGAPQQAQTSKPTAFGTLRGKVTLTGWNPPPPQRAMMINCGNGQIPVPNEKVVLKNNGLENVVIYLKDPPPSATTATAAGAVLDQKECRYVPHVLALRTNQTLTIASSDNMLHNIHALPEINPGINFGMTKPGQRDVSFEKPEIFRVKCDVHPWMMAWIAVFDHPWFAVTANGGRFEIPSIPAGPQTIVAWHEQFGEIEQTVTITTDQAREITINFKPPDAAQ